MEAGLMQKKKDLRKEIKSLYGIYQQGKCSRLLKGFYLKYRA